MGWAPELVRRHLEIGGDDERDANTWDVTVSLDASDGVGVDSATSAKAGLLGGGVDLVGESLRAETTFFS
jgi:hypothetical protein